ncbi:shikimate kinase [Paracoccaceae bacterium GXU_MW_L88]
MEAPPRNILLIGPGGVGKTTFGQRLAARLDLPFHDLDAIFCAQVLNIRRFIETRGYTAYARRNGRLLVDLLEGATGPMVVALSSGVLSADMPEPLRSRLIAKVKQSGEAFLILPHTDDATAAEIVAARQITRGFGLRYEPEREKYLRRIREYRQLGFREIIVPPEADGDTPLTASVNSQMTLRLIHEMT